MARHQTARGAPATDAERILTSEEASLLDIVDNVLNKGVVLSGDLTIALAQVDLIYARLSLLLCAADRVLPSESTDFMERHHRRHELRIIRDRQRLAGAGRGATRQAASLPARTGEPAAGRSSRNRRK